MNYPSLKNSLLENFLEDRYLTQNDFKQIYGRVCHIYEQEISQWKDKCEKLEKENYKMKKIMDSDISNSIQSGFQRMQSMMNNGGPIPRMFSIVIDSNKSDDDGNAIDSVKNSEKTKQESIFIENLKSQIMKETNNEIEKKNNDNLRRIFMENIKNDKNSFFVADSILKKSNNNSKSVYNPFDNKLSNSLEKTIKNQNKKVDIKKKDLISQDDKEVLKINKSLELASFFDKTMKITNDKTKNPIDLFNLWKEYRDNIKCFMDNDDFKLVNKKINSLFYNPTLDSILKKQRMENHLQNLLFQKYLFK